MSKDTKQLLRDAAPRPSSTPDFDELWREGRRQRRTGQAAGVLTVLAAVGLVVLMVTTVLPASPSGVEVAGQPPKSQPTATADVGILGKLPGAPLSIGYVAAAWTDTPEGAAALWSEFRLSGSPPELDGRALILAATGESGSCPSELEAVEVDDGRLFLQIVDRPRTSPAPADYTCTSDFNPITFVLRTDTSVLSPPFIVDFGQTSVRVDTAGAVAFADYGERAPDQLVQIDEDEFEVLAAAATKDPSLKGHVFRDADGAAALWEMADVQGSAPTLPDGTVGVFVIARDAESTCRSPQDVIRVEIVDRVAVVVLDPEGQFVQPCPGPSGAAAFTAFVVAIPDRYDDNLTGADSRLAEPGDRRSPATGGDSRDDQRRPPSASDLVGARWSGPTTGPAPSGSVNVIRGPSHCDWESSIWLHLGWPLGTAAESDHDIRQYVRDPADVLPETVEKKASLNLDADLPGEAEPTGYHAEGVELWLGQDGGDNAVYVVFEEHVERWPRTAEVIACA